MLTLTGVRLCEKRYNRLLAPQFFMRQQQKGVVFLENWCIIFRILVAKDAVEKGSKIDIQRRGTAMCIAAANRIINRTNAQNEWRSTTGKSRVKLTGKRLQKLLYLCQLFWYIDHDESKMITEDFQAWPNGPVIPQIYNHFSVYQDGDMCPLLHLSNSTLSEEEASLINKVVDNTIDIPTEAIIDYTHLPNGPWAQVYSGNQGLYNTISKDSIKYYIRNPDHQTELFEFIQDGQKYECNG